ncbi:MAG TPA: BNR-repeat neuraminidase N-terminal domain-containing protein, partial [Prolixibacteraceae bacterium]|nr:BNR-repeat neuraminidase N-terminal domain-containing protein [Prolixibacteraceae bacterium]
MITSLLLLILLSLTNQCKNDIPVPYSPDIVSSAEISGQRIPLFTGRLNENMVNVKFTVNEGKENILLSGVSVSFTDGSNLSGISSVKVNYSGENRSFLFGTSIPDSGKLIFKGSLQLVGNTHYLSFDFMLKPGADLLTRFGIREVTLVFKDGKTIKIPSSNPYIYRTAILLRAKGQDKCDTYRIPGLVTTSKGTLIAVYDNRYNNSKDLQEDIDIGMSRSTDGGQTWEP